MLFAVTVGKVRTKMIKSYSRLITFSTFMERFEYLALNGRIGEMTFGSKRYLNQIFYTSDEWRSIRDEIIVRDNGCDLAVPDYDIGGLIYIHHINPITLDDIEKRRSCVLDPDNLVCVSRSTHEAIHYRDPKLLIIDRNKTRTPGDTKLW